MRFICKAEIKAPISFVFNAFSDFSKFEMRVIGHGMSIVRLDDLTTNKSGMEWNISGILRGKNRSFGIILENYSSPDKLKFMCKGKLLSFKIRVILEKLETNITEATIKVDPEAKNIGSRLVLQSAKLARRTIESRMKKRLVKFAEEVEVEYEEN